MKSFFTTLCALAALASISRADNILIYQGYQNNRVNTPFAAAGVFGRFYWLFDLTTLQATPVSFGDKSGTKSYTVGTPVSFVYDPVAGPLMATESNFEIGSSNMSASFALSFADFFGANVAHNFGGTFVSLFPDVMSYTNFSITGSGTTGTDTVTTDRGLFDLNLTLTRSSNVSNDDLAAATAIVTAYLASLGYTAAAPAVQR